MHIDHGSSDRNGNGGVTRHAQQMSERRDKRAFCGIYCDQNRDGFFFFYRF